ncbi:MAG: tetratricopeptide repeat protein, partial [Terriglobia bacterium]
QLKDLYDKATALYNQQKFTEAAAVYAQAVPMATGPNAEVLEIKEAAAYDGAQQYDKAVQVLQQGLQADPKSKNLHVALGNVYADQGNIEAAKKELATAGQTADIKILEQREQVAKANQKFSSLKQVFTAADSLYSQGQYSQAAATFEKAVPTATGKNLPIVLGRAADSYDKAKMYPQAADTYEKAIQADPTNASFYNNLGNVYGHLGKFGQAVQQYEKAAQLDPPNAANYYFNEGALMENSGKFSQAAAAFKKATVANPKAANAYYLEAQALMGEAKVGPDGKVEPAPGTIEALQQYLQIAPTGQYASQAQQMLQTLTGKVQTQYRKH